MKRTRAAPCCSRTHSPSESRSLFVCALRWQCVGGHVTLFRPRISPSCSGECTSRFCLIEGCSSVGWLLTVFLVAPLVHFPPTRALILWSPSEPDWHHLPLGNGIISLPFPQCSASLDNSPRHLGPNDCLWVPHSLGEIYQKWYTKYGTKLKIIFYRNNILVTKLKKKAVCFLRIVFIKEFPTKIYNLFSKNLGIKPETLFLCRPFTLSLYIFNISYVCNDFLRLPIYTVHIYFYTSLHPSRVPWRVAAYYIKSEMRLLMTTNCPRLSLLYFAAPFVLFVCLFVWLLSLFICHCLA